MLLVSLYTCECGGLSAHYKRSIFRNSEAEGQEKKQDGCTEKKVFCGCGFQESSNSSMEKIQQMRSRLQKVLEISQEEICQKQDFNAWMKKPERSGKTGKRKKKKNRFREQLKEKRQSRTSTNVEDYICTS